FLGPNGAGKSTTMRMVTGYLTPTAGKVTIGGVSIDDDPVAAKGLFGYLPESAPLYSDMTVSSFLNFTAEIRGLSGAARARALDRVLDLCFLDSVRNQSVDTLSKGYRHRTCFAQSIIHDPDVLILDEPTDGLDPNQKHEVRSMIKRMGETKAIIFSTHILEEVDAACSRAMIIDRGKMVADGTPEELRQRSPRAGALKVSLGGASGAAIKSELARITGVSEVEEAKSSEAGFEGVLIPKDRKVAEKFTHEVMALAAAKNWKVEELHTLEGRLDEVFRNLTSPDTAA
ncbi:MAG: ATP-binding cassette domain-containing protein, partial [Verrucomicrobiales bacterium]|nr:ATP-binding cassette domain-containing protein [Verrucomicrobiales bacterium]